MANIFKTTLKKDIIADIANNNTREIRFPITKFWATRFADEFNLDEKTFTFKTFDALELSSPSNKDTISETFVFEFVKTYVNDGEFVVEFKDSYDRTESCVNIEDCIIENTPIEDTEKTEEISKNEDDMELEKVFFGEEDDIDSSDVYFNDENNDDCEFISDDRIFESVKYFFDEEKILDKICEDDVVFATNAIQVIVLPNGKVLGSNKTLPVNNDVEVRIEFDMRHKIYFDSTDFDLYIFEDLIFDFLSKIKKNNFVFIWKRYTGIFKDNDGRVYFGIKYSTRKSIGFNRKYNVQ